MSKRIYSLGWSAVENAQTYRVFRSLTEVGNKQELVLTSKRSLELNQYIPGSSDYYYFIKAQATGYQDSDYSTPLRWKTFSISRSVDTGVIETTDDYFVGEGFGYNTGFVAPEGKIFNRAVCLLTIGGIQHPEYISFLTDDKAFNIDIPAEAVTGDIVYSAVVQDEITQLAAPTIAMNADGKTLEITDVENAQKYKIYANGELKTTIPKAAQGTQTTYDLTNLNLSAGNYVITVVAEAEGFTDSDASNSVNYTVQSQLATPTIAMNADGKTLEITDVENATSYDVYVDGALKTNVASIPNTTTFDLSTLSDIADGAHTVKVKAKADGYRDSEFSNEVSYTKTSAPPVYTVTFSSDFTVTGTGHLYGIYYINETGERTLLPVTEDNYTTYRSQTFKASSIDDISGNWDYGTITIDGTAYYSSGWSNPHLPLTLSAPATITNIYSDY